MELISSQISHDNDYRDLGSRGLPHCSQEMPGDFLNSATTIFFYIFPVLFLRLLDAVRV